MKRLSQLMFRLVLPLMLVSLACAISTPASAPTATPVPPTETQVLVTPTNTPLPTATLKPTNTPNVEATQKAEKFQSTLAEFKEKGYIGSAEGESIPIKDFKGEFAQINNYYKWWWQDGLKGQYKNFVFSAHFEWKSYSSTPDVSGCGIGFGIKENGYHYAVFLDRENIAFVRAKGSRLYQVGAAGGDRFPPIPLPAKADFVVAVWDSNVTVSVNGVIVLYILSSDQDAQGKVAFSLLSGGNGGYGTRCEMSNIVFWTPK